MKPRTRHLLSLLLTATVVGAAAMPPTALCAPKVPARDDVPFWTGMPSSATFAKRQDERLAKARAAIEKMVAVKGARTIANTLVPS